MNTTREWNLVFMPGLITSQVRFWKHGHSQSVGIDFEIGSVCPGHVLLVHVQVVVACCSIVGCGERLGGADPPVSGCWLPTESCDLIAPVSAAELNVAIRSAANRAGWRPQPMLGFLAFLALIKDPLALV